MNALLLHGGKITAKVTKDSHTSLCAKTARNLLAQFHHAKIGLGPIVIKRHVKIMHETQDQVLILMQADQEIEASLFFGAPLLPMRFCGGGLAAIPLWTSSV